MNALDLRLDLRVGAEDVAVVLRQAAHAHHPVQRAGALIAVQAVELGHADRQFAVGSLAVVEDLHVAGAVHRLDRQHLAVGRLAGEHAVVELLPVAGALPQRAVEHLRRLDLDIVRRFHPSTDIVLQGAVQRPALRVPEDHPAALFLDVEEVHGRPDLAVVALLGLLQPLQIGGEIGVAGPGRAVDALQLGVVLIAPPIGAGQLGQLERLADMPRRGQVRPAAQVLPGALAIERDRLVAGDVADDLRLVRLADRLEVGDGLVAVPHLARDRLVAVDDLAHARLDRRQVVQRERLVSGEVVIEAVLDIGADRHLCVGEQFLHRLGQNVGGVVADDLQRLWQVTRDDLDLAAVVQRAGEVQQLAVQLDQQSLLFQGFGDGAGDVASRHSVLERSVLAVGEFQVDHGSLKLPRTVWCARGNGVIARTAERVAFAELSQAASAPPRSGPCRIRASAA